LLFLTAWAVLAGAACNAPADLPVVPMNTAGASATETEAPRIADGRESADAPPVSNRAGSDELPSCLGLGAPVDSVHQEFFRLINSFREENGLAPLEYSVHLEAAADGYAQRMQAENFFGHIGPGGDTAGDRAVTAGFCDRRVGENLSWGLNSRSRPAEVMENLIASEPHLANLLLPDYRYVGVGYWTVTDESGQWFWWVQLFAVDAR
jgi:uncharacterized protein YkwD